MQVRCLALILGVICVLAGGPAPAQTRPATTTAPADVTVEQLLALIPGDIASDPRGPAFDVAGAILTRPYRVRFRAAQREDGAAMLYLEDIDEVPVLLFVDGHALIYDGARGRLIHATATEAEFRFFSNGSKITLAMKMALGIEDPLERVLTTQVDPRSLSTYFDAWSITREGGRRYAMRAARKDTLARFDFDLDAPVPFTGLQLAMPDDKRPAVWLIERLTIGQPVDASLFAFPAPDAMVRVAPRHEVGRVRGGEPEADEVVEAMLRALMFQYALAVPAARDDFGKRFGPIDWAHRRRENDWLAEPLRELFGPRYPRAPAPAIAPDEER